MNKRIARIFLPIVALTGVVSTGAVAVESTDMGVRGTIMPVACDVSISDNGVVDFGNYFAGDLTGSDFTRAGEKSLTVSLNCSAATKVAITASDARAGTAPAGIAQFLFSNQADGSAFGVGSVDGKNVGGYILRRTTAGSGDGKELTSIVSDDSGATWFQSGVDSRNALTPTGRQHSWAELNQTVPGMFATITQAYGVVLALNKKDDMPDLTNSIPIDGLATLTVRYL